MKNDELKEIITQAHMAGQHCADPDIGNASYSDAHAYYSTLPEPKAITKEQDVCSECNGKDVILDEYADGSIREFPCESCTGKSPVDKIREAFEKWFGQDDTDEELNFAAEYQDGKDRFAQGFYGAYESQQAKIERLKAENESIQDRLANCWNCGYYKNGCGGTGPTEKVCFEWKEFVL